MGGSTAAPYGRCGSLFLLLPSSAPVSTVKMKDITPCGVMVSRASHARLQARSVNRGAAVSMAEATEAPKIIIAGAPASGKGTQCEMIKERYGVVHLSTGDILRAAVKEGTDLGKQAQGFMDAGKLVPDDVIIGVIAERLLAVCAAHILRAPALACLPWPACLLLWLLPLRTYYMHVFYSTHASLPR